MKVVGLPYSKMADVVAGVDPALVFKPADENISATATLWQGYLAYPAKVVVVSIPGPCAACDKPGSAHTHNGVLVPGKGWIHKPCVHVQLDVAKQAIAAGAHSVYVRKVKLTPWAWTSKANYIVDKALAAGETCHHIGAPSKAGSVAPTVAPPATPPAPVMPPTTPTDTTTVTLGGTLVEGPALPAGESTGLAGTPRRNTMAAVATLYMLQEVSLAIADVLDVAPSDPWLAAALGRSSPHDTTDAARVHAASVRARLARPWYHEAGRKLAALREVDEFIAVYTHYLARNCFDYLAMACAGESRFWSGWTTHKPASRAAAWTKALTYDPRSVVRTAEEVFRRGKWGSGAYGGPRWGLIAHVAGKYFSWPPLVFLDHCVSLQHNGGLAYNKGYILDMPGSGYLDMLDAKAAGSLLAAGTWPISTWAHPHDPAHTAAWAIGMAVELGVIPPPGATLTPTSDPYVPPMSWGEKVWTITTEVGYVSPTPAPLPVIAKGSHHASPSPTSTGTPWDVVPPSRRESFDATTTPSA